MVGVASSAAADDALGLSTLDLLPLDRALVRQLAFTGAGTTGAEPLARAALASLVEHIGARATPERRGEMAASKERELRFLAAALSDTLA